MVLPGRRLVVPDLADPLARPAIGRRSKDLRPVSRSMRTKNMFGGRDNCFRGRMSAIGPLLLLGS